MRSGPPRSPDEVLLDFAQSTYDAASTLGKWDRGALRGKETSLAFCAATFVISTR